MASPAARTLAVLGGEPAFAEMLHVGRPNLGDRARFAELVDGIWSRRRFTNDGPLAQEFERRLAELLQVRHVVAVCNGTAGLELTIRALGLTGEVIVPAFTFIATVHALHRQGLRPVFADVDPETHTLDPAHVESLWTSQTSAVLGVHVWGHPCRIEELQALTRRHGARLIFDAAHAFAGTHAGRPIGGCGDAEVFSFHATKFIHTGEGGAVATNSDALAAALRLQRNFGFADYDRVDSEGTNAKLSELHAALGLVSLERLGEFLDVNRSRQGDYARHLADLPGISLLRPPQAEQNNCQYVVVEVDAARCPLNRDELLQVLHAEGVLARRYFYPGCHRSMPYRELLAGSIAPLPVTDRLCRSLLQLPTGTAVEPADIARIGVILSQALEDAGEVRRALSQSAPR